MIQHGQQLSTTAGLADSRSRESAPPHPGPSLTGQGVHLQVFLLALPMGLSSSSKTMHTSSIRRTCSSLYPARSLSRAEAAAADGRTSRARDVSTSGNTEETLSAVTRGGLVIVVVVLIVKWLGLGNSIEQGQGQKRKGRGANNKLSACTSHIRTSVYIYLLPLSFFTHYSSPFTLHSPSPSHTWLF